MFSEKILKEIEQSRVRLTDTLIAFIKTDTILFAFDEKCADFYTPYVTAANKILNTVFVLTIGLEVAAVNFEQDAGLQAYLKRLPVYKFAVLYLAAIKVRSVLLGVLFAEGKISAEQLFSAGFYEELWQQSKWGAIAETDEQHKNIRNELAQLERLRNEKSLSEN